MLCNLIYLTIGKLDSNENHPSYSLSVPMSRAWGSGVSEGRFEEYQEDHVSSRPASINTHEWRRASHVPPPPN